MLVILVPDLNGRLARSKGIDTGNLRTAVGRVDHSAVSPLEFSRAIASLFIVSSCICCNENRSRALNIVGKRGESILARQLRNGLRRQLIIPSPISTIRARIRPKLMGGWQIMGRQRVL